MSGESVLFWSDAGLRPCEFLPGEAVVCRVDGRDCGEGGHGGGGLVVAESEERALGRTKTGEAMEECVSFGDAAVEAEVPLFLFLDLDLLRAFGREMESEEPREQCVSFGGRLEEALVFAAGCRGAYVMSSFVLVLLIVGYWFLAILVS